MIWIVELLGGTGFSVLGFLWVGFPEVLDRQKSRLWKKNEFKPTDSTLTDMRLSGLGFLLVGVAFVLQALSELFVV
ncbi:hypothetical protein SAMN04487950_0513 [Halogranum rubrum]|uniref:Uncharacterized protein n=1 Tax=Halogranum rubrum TaxID=553466 RepID=A0A1I4BFP8_9EURY|nr:hypothetical protein [Halogranum rubrum]SFK67303.1 hypothetical protein SAMN04487950_0513 [Halogranum rubrum]